MKNSHVVSINFCGLNVQLELLVGLDFSLGWRVKSCQVAINTTQISCLSLILSLGWFYKPALKIAICVDPILRGVAYSIQVFFDFFLYQYSASN